MPDSSYKYEALSSDLTGLHYRNKDALTYLLKEFSAIVYHLGIVTNGFIQQKTCLKAFRLQIGFVHRVIGNGRRRGCLLYTSRRG